MKNDRQNANKLLAGFLESDQLKAVDVRVPVGQNSEAFAYAAAQMEV